MMSSVLTVEQHEQSGSDSYVPNRILAENPTILTALCYIP